MELHRRIFKMFTTTTTTTTGLHDDIRGPPSYRSLVSQVPDYYGGESSSRSSTRSPQPSTQERRQYLYDPPPPYHKAMNDRPLSSPSTGRQHQLHHHSSFYDPNFDYTLPRPPALGEERSHTAGGSGFASETARPTGLTVHHHLHHHHQMDQPSYKFGKGAIASGGGGGSSSSSSQYKATSSPVLDKCGNEVERTHCLQWAHSLHKLLQDPYGVKLFLSYLESEGPQHAEALHFWFACEGLKNHNDVEKIQRLVKLIYKKYFMKSALPINEDLRKLIMKKMKTTQCLYPPVTLFDEAQAQVEHLINKSTYPNFLKSDIYLECLQSADDGQTDYYQSDTGSPGSPVCSRDLSNFAGAVGQLPTLHENMEFNPQPSTHYTPGCHTPTVRLTQEMLLISQQHRALDIRPKSETYAGLIYRGNKGHAAYNSYNPVSRQDSEMQSLSSHSDARTESDSMSLRDEFRDGSRRQKSASHFACKNKETDMNQPFIPRTQRLDDVPRMDFTQHAALLKEKLKNLKREIDSQDLIHRRLQEGDPLSSLDESTIRNKLQFHDIDSDQDILDEHVSRVFADCSLPLSPDVSSSPRPARSPPVRLTRRHRDKDVFSTFSGDSGNVHDFNDPTLPKSKSMSIPQQQKIRSSSSSNKKTLTELTDSGVSVISDPASAASVKDSTKWVRSWLRDSEYGNGGGGGGTMSEMAVRDVAGRKYKRSSSLERNCVKQPFVADPSMPPPPWPDTDIQLEETRRRLVQEDRTRLSYRSSNKYHPGDMITGSSQSTLRKPSKSVTPVVLSFCDEQVPYLIKVPGIQITLRQFKDVLPKKGNYRYFFKTVCPDLSNQVTNEEVTNDSDVLPLWEGKIMAQVKQMD